MRLNQHCVYNQKGYTCSMTCVQSFIFQKILDPPWYIFIMPFYSWHGNQRSLLLVSASMLGLQVETMAFKSNLNCSIIFRSAN